jgi:hypothetical protein
MTKTTPNDPAPMHDPKGPARPRRPPSARTASPPYEAPEVLPLGAVRAVTAGPVQDPDKNMDQLFGGPGGFARQDALS